MGTVPDPLRSAKLALIAASEGENSLGELKSPKHQQKQASIESSSNGYPFNAKIHPAGEHSFDVNCRTEASMPRGEHHGGVDISQPSMFSPGSSSFSKDDSRATEEEPGKDTRQEGSNGCNAKDQALTDSHNLMNTEIKEPGTQEDCKMVHSGAGEPLCSQVDDKAILSTGRSGSITENITHDINSSLIPSHHGDQQVSSAAKETVGGSSGPEKPQVLLSAKELGPVSDPGLKAKVCLDTESGGTKKASFHSSVRTQQEPPPKSSLERAPPQLLSHNETSEKPLPELLKFKDTGTMTVQPESTSVDREIVSRTRQDAEVQAVASVESRSASTSPSILAAFLRENMPSETKQNQEQLHIIYRSASGKEQSKIIDGLAVLGQTAPSAGIMPEVRIQAPAGAENRLGSQAVSLQDDLAKRQDAACLSLQDNSERPCPSGSTQEISVKGMEVQIARGVRSLGSIAQQPLDASVLQITKPVDQISVHASDQPVVTPQPANPEAKLPLCSALSEINSKHQNLSPSATENQLASSSSCPRILESAKALVTNATESGQQNQPQIKTLGDVETAPTSCHMGVKSKREGTVVHLGSKEQKMNAIGAPAGAQTVGASVTSQTGQNISPGDNRKVEASASQKLTAGRTESQPSCHSVPGLLAKISVMGKESKLAVPIATSSIQAVPSPSKKKKDIKPIPDTKVHVKQSKHVRDVVWDEQGMTWEVYGASLDPESLGIAIQNHLQRQIREHEKLIKAQSAQTRKSISSDTSSNKKLKGRQHNVFQSMLQNFRRPNCCVRPTASSVLD